MQQLQDRLPERVLSRIVFLSDVVYLPDPLFPVRNHGQFQWISASISCLPKEQGMFLVATFEEHGVKYAAVCFRGSSNWTDYKTCARFFPVVEREGTFHGGFYMRSNFISSGYFRHFENQGYRLLFCGHSLGGAVAVTTMIRHICASSYVPREDHPLCITFGAPLVGSSDVARLMTARFPHHFIHVVHELDIVPKLLSYVYRLALNVAEADLATFDAWKKSLVALAGQTVGNGVRLMRCITMDLVGTVTALVLGDLVESAGALRLINAATNLIGGVTGSFATALNAVIQRVNSLLKSAMGVIASALAFEPFGDYLYIPSNGNSRFLEDPQQIRDILALPENFSLKVEHATEHFMGRYQTWIRGRVAGAVSHPIVSPRLDSAPFLIPRVDSIKIERFNSVIKVVLHGQHLFQATFVRISGLGGLVIEESIVDDAKTNLELVCYLTTVRDPAQLPSTDGICIVLLDTSFAPPQRFPDVSFSVDQNMRMLAMGNLNVISLLQQVELLCLMSSPSTSEQLELTRINNLMVELVSQVPVEIMVFSLAIGPTASAAVMLKEILSSEPPAMYYSMTGLAFLDEIANAAKGIESLSRIKLSELQQISAMVGTAIWYQRGNNHFVHLMERFGVDYISPAINTVTVHAGGQENPPWWGIVIGFVVLAGIVTGGALAGGALISLAEGSAVLGYVGGGGLTYGLMVYAARPGSTTTSEEVPREQVQVVKEQVRKYHEEIVKERERIANLPLLPQFCGILSSVKVRHQKADSTTPGELEEIRRPFLDFKSSVERAARDIQACEEVLEKYAKYTGEFDDDYQQKLDEAQKKFDETLKISLAIVDAHCQLISIFFDEVEREKEIKHGIIQNDPQKSTEQAERETDRLKTMKQKAAALSEVRVSHGNVLTSAFDLLRVTQVGFRQAIDEMGSENHSMNSHSEWLQWYVKLIRQVDQAGRTLRDAEQMTLYELESEIAHYFATKSKFLEWAKDYSLRISTQWDELMGPAFSKIHARYRFAVAVRARMIYLIFQLRITICKVRLVGIVGVSNEGKTFLLRELLTVNGSVPDDIPQPGLNQIYRTVFPKIYSAPGLGYCVLDNPGGDDQNLVYDSRMLLQIPDVNVIMLPAVGATLKTALGKPNIQTLLDHTKSPVSQVLAPTLTCFNKVDYLFKVFRFRDNIGTSKEIQASKVLLDEAKSLKNQRIELEIREDKTHPRWWTALAPESRERDVLLSLSSRIQTADGQTILRNQTDKEQIVHSLEDVVEWVRLQVRNLNN